MIWTDNEKEILKGVKGIFESPDYFKAGEIIGNIYENPELLK